MNLITFLAAFLGFISIVYCEITVLKNVQVIYDRSPKLRIIGDGFLPVEDLEFTLSSSGENILKQDIDFFVSNATDNGITFRLLPQKKWVDLSGRVPPVSLVLERVVFKDTPTKNLLYQSNSINIANVLESPSIVQNDDTLYATASNELRINGTGFEGAKKVDLYFQPPLRKEIDYEIVSKFPIRKDEVVLRLKHGSAWRNEPGPLSVLALDTGGGPVSVGNVTVAYVEDNLDSHSVSVQDTSKEQLIYHDEASVIIKGTGFSTEVNRLSFANGLLGKGINYTTTSSTTNELHLSLVSGSFWRKNVENLPNFLTLLAVDAGGGFVAVGPVNAGKGRDVATVFERPTITDLSGTAAPQLFRTHTVFSKKRVRII